jgi:hypothetical protein
MSSRRPGDNQRKVERKKRKRRERLEQKRLRDASGPDLVFAPAGAVKMSEVLEEFIGPYREPDDTLDEYRKLVGLGALAWNAALMPADEREEMIDDVVSSSTAAATRSDRAMLRKLINDMITHKETEFPTIDRAVIEYQVEDRGTGYHLLVVSTLGGPRPGG